jgi:hypothetical protein
MIMQTAPSEMTQYTLRKDTLAENINLGVMDKNDAIF